MTTATRFRVQHPRRAWIAALLVPACMLLTVAASGCANSTSIKTEDIVSSIPWSAPESHTYELKVNNKVQGQTTLSIANEGDAVVLTQHAIDDQGNSDDSVVRADATTLKPNSATHTVTDSTVKRIADATYEDTDKDCAGKRVVLIKQSTFKPPDAATSDSSRSSPLCVPEHSYDNDSSLFIWRTIKFEKEYTVTYTTVFSNRRDTQKVTLRVAKQEKMQTPAGEFDTWRVELTADQVSQIAWFATTDDHKLIAYQNESFFFRLMK